MKAAIAQDVFMMAIAVGCFREPVLELSNETLAGGRKASPIWPKVPMRAIASTEVRKGVKARARPPARRPKTMATNTPVCLLIKE